MEKLAFLSIDSPRNITDFGLLLELPALRTLIITNPKKMADFSWMAEAEHLEVIGIEGAMFISFTIPTLEPLAGLRSLKALLAVSTKLADTGRGCGPGLHQSSWIPLTSDGSGSHIGLDFDPWPVAGLDR